MHFRQNLKQITLEKPFFSANTVCTIFWYRSSPSNSVGNNPKTCFIIDKEDRRIQLLFFLTVNCSLTCPKGRWKDHSTCWDLSDSSLPPSCPHGWSWDPPRCCQVALKTIISHQTTFSVLKMFSVAKKEHKCISARKLYILYDQMLIFKILNKSCYFPINDTRL